jgi:hypothetical protein
MLKASEAHLCNKKPRQAGEAFYFNAVPLRYQSFFITRPVKPGIFYAIVPGIVMVTFKSKKSIFHLNGQQNVVFFCLRYYYPSNNTPGL